MQLDQQQRPAFRLSLQTVSRFLSAVITVEGVELLLISFNLWWALILTWWASHVETPVVSPILANRAPIWMWALIWFLCAAWSALGLWGGNRLIRAWGMLFSTIHWGLAATALVAYYFIRGNLTSWTGPAVIITIVAGWTYWRLVFVQPQLRDLRGEHHEPHGH